MELLWKTNQKQDFSLNYYCNNLHCMSAIRSVSSTKEHFNFNFNNCQNSYLCVHVTGGNPLDNFQGWSKINVSRVLTFVKRKKSSHIVAYLLNKHQKNLLPGKEALSREKKPSPVYALTTLY